MLILITGGSGSGKSAFAEQKLLEIASEQGKNCIYLATMSRGEDGESAARIRRHRALRAGKGFGTVEQPLRLDEAKIPDGSAVLLEDLSNLLANEIYLPGGQLAIKERTEEQLAEAVLGPVLALAERASVLVVVTNEIFSDGWNSGDSAYSSRHFANQRTSGRSRISPRRDVQTSSLPSSKCWVMLYIQPTK